MPFVNPADKMQKVALHATDVALVRATSRSAKAEAAAVPKEPIDEGPSLVDVRRRIVRLVEEARLAEEKSAAAEEAVCKAQAALEEAVSSGSARAKAGVVTDGESKEEIAEYNQLVEEARAALAVEDAEYEAAQNTAEKAGSADARGGILLASLTHTYRAEHGEALEFRKFGYVKLPGMLFDIYEIRVDYAVPSSPQVRMTGEAWHGPPTRGIAVKPKRGAAIPHEKTRLDVMYSLERTASVSGRPQGLHESALALAISDGLDNAIMGTAFVGLHILHDDGDDVHGGETPSQRAFASHRRKRVERQQKVALERAAHASSIVARVPAPRKKGEVSDSDSDGVFEDEPEAEALLALRLAELMKPPEPVDVAFEALLWGWLQPVRLAVGAKSTVSSGGGVWGALQQNHDTKDMRAIMLAKVRPGTLTGENTGTCTLGEWDGEEHCAVGAAELDPTGTAGLVYWQVTVRGKPGSLVLGVLRASRPDKESHDADIAREKRRLSYRSPNCATVGAVTPDHAVQLSYRTGAEHRADLPNMWPSVWTAFWSISYLHGPEWNYHYHLHYEDSHRAAALMLQKGFRRFAPIIKARNSTKAALEAARPGGRYDRQFWGWGSNGAVFESGVRSRGGPWDVSRIAEGEVFIFKMERGKLSFLVPRTGVTGSVELPWEDVDGMEGAEVSKNDEFVLKTRNCVLNTRNCELKMMKFAKEWRKELIGMMMDAKRAQHEAERLALPEHERVSEATGEPTHYEQRRIHRRKEIEQELADALDTMEIRQLMRRAAGEDQPVECKDEFRVCADLTSECDVTLERIPPFDPREF